MLHSGYAEEEARNLLLLLFVLFENFQTFNSRSERHSIVRQRFFTNPFLVLTVIAAQLVHIGAMHVPALQDILHVAPVSLREWTLLLLAACSLLLVMELEKWWDQRSRPRRARSALS
ncbi:MAG: cation transporting ATPase C-terminal domain-containing protein [Reyranella sp.]